MKTVWAPATEHSRWLSTLPHGTILIDENGLAYQVARRLLWPDEIQLMHVGGEEIYVLRTDGAQATAFGGVSYPPASELTEVWRPAT